MCFCSQPCRVPLSTWHMLSSQPGLLTAGVCTLWRQMSPGSVVPSLVFSLHSLYISSSPVKATKEALGQQLQMVMKKAQRRTTSCNLGLWWTHQTPGTDLETHMYVLTRTGKEEASRPHTENQSPHLPNEHSKPPDLQSQQEPGDTDHTLFQEGLSYV